MGYDIYNGSGYGILLGEKDVYGYGQAEVWATGTLKDFVKDMAFQKLVEKEYPLLNVELAGDSTFECIIYLTISSVTAKDSTPDAKAAAQLESFIERFQLEDAPAWHEWTSRL